MILVYTYHESVSRGYYDNKSYIYPMHTRALFAVEDDYDDGISLAFIILFYV